jgi:hypothetical protein
MLAGTFPVLLSSDLLAEYRLMLLRPNIQRFHGLDAAEVDALLTQITAGPRLQVPRWSRQGSSSRKHLAG